MIRDEPSCFSPELRIVRAQELVTPALRHSGNCDYRRPSCSGARVTNCDESNGRVRGELLYKLDVTLRWTLVHHQYCYTPIFNEMSKQLTADRPLIVNVRNKWAKFICIQCFKYESRFTNPRLALDTYLYNARRGDLRPDRPNSCISIGICDPLLVVRPS